MQAGEQINKAEGEAAVGRATDQKDLGALWAITILFSLLCTLVGLTWVPVHYDLIPSREADPLERRTQDLQNQLLIDALNQGKVTFDSRSMSKVAAPRPFYEVFLLDLTRILLFPTFPLLAIASMVRKTLREARGSLSLKRKGRPSKP